MSTESSRQPSPVFIVGSPRSGTSATVDALIAAGYHGYREGNFLPLAHRIATTIDSHFEVFDIGTRNVLVGLVDKDELKRNMTHHFLTIADSLNPNGPWFDKTGGADMIRFLPTVLNMWPNAIIIFSRRRAIENIVSRIKKFPKATFEHHCIDWSRTMRAWREIRDTLPKTKIMEIDQYDMVHNPAETASRFASFLHATPERENAIEAVLTRSRPQETEKGSANRVWSLEETGWSEEQLEMFDTHCSGEMAAFGYTVGASYRHTEP